MSYQLKIKAKSLAEEAKIIKSEEAKQLRLQRKYLESKYRAEIFKDEEAAKGADSSTASWRAYTGLRDHRKIDVRQEARATNVARGFLKGLKYSQIETLPKRVGNNVALYQVIDGPKWERVVRLIEKYGSQKDVRERLPGFLQEAGVSVTKEVVEQTRPVLKYNVKTL